MHKLFSLTLIFIGIQFAGETGKLIGKIMDKNENLLIGVNVILEGTLSGSATDERGNFSIHNIPASNYNVIFSDTYSIV